jgi:methionyl-tRNA formyltransferase
LKIVYMGTPDFAIPSLESLMNAGHEIQAVFTQPDKPKNRGQKLTMPPIKEFALRHGLPVFQPQSLRKGSDAEAALQTLRELRPDFIVVVAYGQILPPEVLDVPLYCCVNVHASLLPKYRGAAPIQWALINGEKKTGVTTMYMDQGLDTGDIILKEEYDIPEGMTAPELSDVLSHMGAKLLVETIEKLVDGTAPRIKQCEGDSCYACMIHKDMCKLDFTKSAKELDDFIRGISSCPCAYTMLGSKRLKIYNSALTGETSKEEPGHFIYGDTLRVVCGDGRILRLTEIQLEGGKKMTDVAFMRGRKSDFFKE